MIESYYDWKHHAFDEPDEPTKYIVKIGDRKYGNEGTPIDYFDDTHIDKKMNDYTIYCTVEQAKKALELGAPIEILPNYTEYRVLPLVKCKDGNDRPCIIPTAEQMIGWLEEQSIIERVDICCLTSWGYMIMRDDYAHPYICVSKNEGFSSRKNATIAAIDAALEYLEKNLNNNGHYPLHRRTDKESL